MDFNQWLMTMGDEWGPDLPSQPQEAARLAWKACRRSMLLDLWDALPMHEKSGDLAGSLRATLLFSEVGDEIRETRFKSGPA